MTHPLTAATTAAALSVLLSTASTASNASDTWYQPYMNCISLEDFVVRERLGLAVTPHDPDELIQLLNTGYSERGMTRRVVDITPTHARRDVRIIASTVPNSPKIALLRGEQYCWSVLSAYTKDKSKGAH